MKSRKLSGQDLEIVARHMAIDVLLTVDDAERIRIAEWYFSRVSKGQLGALAGFMMNHVVWHFDALHTTSDGEQLATEIYLDAVKATLPPLTMIGGFE